MGRKDAFIRGFEKQAAMFSKKKPSLGSRLKVKAGRTALMAAAPLGIGAYALHKIQERNENTMMPRNLYPSPY